jgi:hypothetical protein
MKRSRYVNPGALFSLEVSQLLLLQDDSLMDGCTLADRDQWTRTDRRVLTDGS